MSVKNDIHYKFASYFDQSKQLGPYLYALHQKIAEGHVCLDVTNALDPDILEKYRLVQPEVLIPNDLVGTEQDVLHPFILDGSLLYTQRMFRYEVQSAVKIRELVLAPPFRVDVPQLKTILQQYFEPGDATVDWQLLAAISAVLYNFTIITGGPGTGKTTTVAKILAILWQLFPNYNIAMAAPTGKAANRMSESLQQATPDLHGDVKQKIKNLPVLTLHRLLGTIKDSTRFRHHEAYPLPYDVIIVDESSMMDIAIFAKLLNATSRTGKLILLGDSNQLASVEAGSLFGDICNMLQQQHLFSPSFTDAIQPLYPELAMILKKEYTVSAAAHLLTNHIITLEKSYRFRDDEGIGAVSKAVIANNTLMLEQLCDSKGNDLVHFDFENDAVFFEQFIHQYRNYMLDETDNRRSITDALSLFNYCRVLAATRQNDLGVYNLNIRIEQYLHQQGWINMYDAFYDYKPIMITNNNYNLDLYNGDIGLFKRDESDGVVYAHFLGKDEAGNVSIKKVLPGFLSDYETCYAMTIHKSQGSEFDKVLVVLPDKEDHAILSRELVYTAITRAKKEVYIQSPRAVFMAACNKKIVRNSGLRQRLK